MREAMMLEFERDPTFRMDDVHDLTRPEVRERIMTRVKRTYIHTIIYTYPLNNVLDP